jgi:peptidoglycan hydrolase-like protein with peptidoglycan-binding domain
MSETNTSGGSTTPRLIVGDDTGTFKVPTTYVALIPADRPINQDELARLAIVDILTRNGMPTDATTVEQILEMEKKAGIGFTDESTQKLKPLEYGVWPGASYNGTNPDGTYTGYAVTLDYEDQQRVLDYRKQILGPPLGQMDDQTKEKILLVIEALKQIAKVNGNEALSGALDEIQTGIEGGDQDKIAKGFKMAGGGPAALFKLFEEVYDRKLDAKGAGILTVGERYANIKGIDAMNGFEVFGRISKAFSVGGDAANIYLNTYKMYRGVDENGKPLTPMQYAEAGLDLAQSLQSVGSIVLEKAGEKFASTSLLRAAAFLEAANVPLAIVSLQYYGMKYVVEGAVQINQVSADYEFRRRMGSQNMSASEFAAALDRKLGDVDKMPTGPNNAAQTIVRLNHMISDGGKTAEMWHRYAGLAIEPREMAEKLSSAKNIQEVLALGLSEKELTRYAEGFKKAYPAFVEACAKDAATTVLMSRTGYEPWRDVLKNVPYVSLSDEKIQQLRKAEIDLKSLGLNLVPDSIINKLAKEAGFNTSTNPGSTASSSEQNPSSQNARQTGGKSEKGTSPMEDGRLQEGERGKEVRWLQGKLEDLGYTDDKGKRIGHAGIYQHATAEAVAKFQKDHGLAATGVADAATLKALINTNVEPRLTRTDNGSRALADGVLREGERGPEVGVLQKFLSKLGYTDEDGKALPSTGMYGKSTREAVSQFQRENGIPETGIADGYTLAKIQVAQPRPAMNDSVLRPGESGPDVKDLQTTLKELGFQGKDGRELKETGRYDQDTAAAVKAYQQQNGLPATGIADRTTLIKLGVVIEVPSETPSPKQRSESTVPANTNDATTSRTPPENPSRQSFEDARYIIENKTNNPISKLVDDFFEKNPIRHWNASEESNRNISTALLIAAVKQDLHDINRVMLNKDGTRLIAVQGDERSEFCKTASVVIQDAVKQPAQESFAQIALMQTANATGTVKQQDDTVAIAAKPMQIESSGPRIG